MLPPSKGCFAFSGEFIPPLPTPLSLWLGEMGKERILGPVTQPQVLELLRVQVVALASKLQ